MPWYEVNAAGVLSLNGLSGAVSLAVVGGSIAAAGNTITITVTPGATSWADLTGKPLTFPPSAHSHAIADVSGLQTALDGKQSAGSYAAASHTHTSSQITDFASAVASAAPVQSVAGRSGAVVLAKADVGLGSVDNTADASKPLSTAQAAADAAVQAYAVQRGNHTGTQLAATISDFATSAVAAVTWTTITGKPSTFPPSTHTHVVADVTGLQVALDGKQASGSYVLTTDSRLSDSREWSASTVTQAEAEAGTGTGRVAWTVLRVWQAIAAWWAASSAKAKLDGIADGATANQTDAYLLSRANHTGTQAAATVTGLSAVATTGAYADLSGKPTVPVLTYGTAPASGGNVGDFYLRISP